MLKLENLRERNVGIAVGAYFHELFDFDKDIRAENIESVRDFFQRVYDAIGKIKKSGYENIIIVSHGGVHHAVRAYANNLE